MEYKFNEDKTIKIISSYIKDTYTQHYAKDKKYQATDIIFDAGQGEGFCLGNIIKYAMRYKRKDKGYLSDIKKLIHYAIILYGEETKKLNKNVEEETEQEYLSMKKEIFPRNKNGTRKGWYK
tara:strand:- start:539 stop:904 length:366 start_codon:yes stop_codon:yes gene_type:complete